ncbi:ParB/RepB/Spo0J family partition protein [beta proteobacterium MWH-UniP1]
MNTVKKKGLGRGLDALLGGVSPAIESGSNQKTLSISQLQAGKYQPRQGMDQASLEELAESIRSQGIMQPLLVRSISRASGPAFEIIAGERRFRAAQMAGLKEVPVIVRDVDDQAALAMALIENLQREDLSALEEAQGIDRLIREFGLTHEQAAQAVGRSRSATSNLLRLLQLPAAVQDMLRDQKIDAGHARAMLSLPPAQQRALAERIVHDQLSVRDTERAVAKVIAGATVASIKPKAGAKKAAASHQRDWDRVEEQLSDAIGLPVVLKQGRGSKGELVIRFSSLDELDGVIGRLVPQGLPDR